MYRESEALEATEPPPESDWRPETDASEISSRMQARQPDAIAQLNSAGAATTDQARGNATADSAVRPAPFVEGTYELKFLLNADQSQQVRSWAKAQMQPDPNASSDCDSGYWVNSLYLDSPDFGVLKRTDGFRQRKYRLRRYGTESRIWLEQKRKDNGQVSKRRIGVIETDLIERLQVDPAVAWDGQWFIKRLKRLQLRPVCQVTYQRFACLGTSVFGTTRLTIDRNLCCVPANGWTVPIQPLNTNPLLSQFEVLELKFKQVMPVAFRDLIQQLNLKQGSFSKYRQSAAACLPPLK